MTANKTFKDFLVEDLSVFFNVDEFAAEHELGGEFVLCVVVDNDSSDRSTGYSKEHEYASQEVFQHDKTVYVKSEDFYLPKVDAEMSLDGENFYVEKASENNGIIRIMLSANES